MFCSHSLNCDYWLGCFICRFSTAFGFYLVILILIIDINNHEENKWSKPQSQQKICTTLYLVEGIVWSTTHKKMYNLNYFSPCVGFVFLEAGFVNYTCKYIAYISIGCRLFCSTGGTLRIMFMSLSLNGIHIPWAYS